MPKKTTDSEPVSDYVQARRLGVPFRNADGVLEYPTMRSRPQPDFTLDSFHRLLLIGSLTVAVAYTVWMVVRIPSMPDQVPMHFAADGSVNRYGSPWEILGMTAVMLAAIIGCTVLTAFAVLTAAGVIPARVGWSLSFAGLMGGLVTARLRHQHLTSVYKERRRPGGSTHGDAVLRILQEADNRQS